MCIQKAMHVRCSLHVEHGKRLMENGITLVIRCGTIVVGWCCQWPRARVAHVRMLHSLFMRSHSIKNTFYIVFAEIKIHPGHTTGDDQVNIIGGNYTIPFTLNGRPSVFTLLWHVYLFCMKIQSHTYPVKVVAINCS